MNTQLLAALAGGAAALVGAGWLGLRVKSRGFAPPDTAERDLGTVPVPSGLPAPVQRWYQTAFGQAVPQIETALFWGHARVRINIWMPLYYRVAHTAGRDFRRDMRVTWFGLPILPGLDTFKDGRGMTRIGPADMTGMEIDQAANLSLWGEQALLMPALTLTHPRMRWEAESDHSAVLVVPFQDGEDTLTVTFDASTAMPTRFTAMRYKTPGGDKIPWWIDCLNWQTFNGMPLPSRLSVTWGDEGTPWSYWDVEGVLRNIDVEI